MITGLSTRVPMKASVMVVGRKKLLGVTEF
jgi:hypothetical protein